MSGNEILAYIKGHNSDRNVRKLMCSNPNVDLFNMNAYKKFGEILSICSQDIERNKGALALRGYFGQPMRQKNENCFSQVSSL